MTRQDDHLAIKKADQIALEMTRDQRGFAGAGSWRALHFPREHAQTPENIPCPARTGPAAADQVARPEAGTGAQGRGAVPAGRMASQAPSPAPQAGLQLHTAEGARKYLTASERVAFLKAAEQAGRETRTLCMTLAFAGCRLSEALALTADRVDLAAGTAVFESLKKRRSGLYRAVPVPPALLEALDLAQ